MLRFLTLFLVFFAAQSLFAQKNQDLAVQVGAFGTRVGTSYFDALPFVVETHSPYDLWLYFVPARDAADADAIRKKAIDAGFTNAYIVDFQYIRDNCSLACQFVPNLPDPPPAIDIRSLRNIFFDFDKYYIRPDAREELERLVQYMRQNPEHTVELRAHTDAKGSDEYNQNLSRRRAESAKQYAVARGISPSRIRTAIFGEAAPIAKNELPDGKDTEQGRQFNRRVEVTVFDGTGQQLNLVEKIVVPETLKN